MGLNDTVSAERLHIGFFGMRNAGKSTLVNAVTGQQLSVVSDVKGTTTDPVKKAMELLPLGPVVIIDTPGLDDDGTLGELRVQKARQVLSYADIAVLVVDATVGLSFEDNALVTLFEKQGIPYLIAYNKADELSARPPLPVNALYVSGKTGEDIHKLKEAIAKLTKPTAHNRKIVSDLLAPGDVVVLVTPIDEAAPKGRLILPQQQTMRDILDAHGIFITCQDTELKDTLAALKNPPKLVITDSQAFKKVAEDTPDTIPLTSFSILFARYKGDLKTLVKGAKMLKSLKDGDRVLISEGCTHHRQCNDIGTVKLPGWIEQFSGVKPDYRFTSGGEFPEDLSEYKLIVHCGGCMLNGKEMERRIHAAEDAQIPMVNYGVAIAQMTGILKRSLQPFPEMLKLLEE